MDGWSPVLTLRSAATDALGGSPALDALGSDPAGAEGDAG